VVSLLWLLVCSKPEPVAHDSESIPIVHDSDDPIDSDSERDTVLPDTEPPYVPVVTHESIEDQVLDDSWIFSRDELLQIELVLPHDSWFALHDKPYAYAEARVTINQIELESVGVRLRGKIGSFRPLGSKPKLRIDFNQYVEDQRVYGLESVSLNSSVVDCSYMKEPVAAALFEAAEVPAFRAGYAHLTINGLDYGLYQVVETEDDRFLKRYWADGTGNLYDGKYVWYGGWSYTLLDFGANVDHLYQLEEGTPVGHADIKGVSSALSANWGGPHFYAQTGKVVDWPAVHRAWAVEQWLGQLDGYVLNKNNYRVYFDPADGKAEFIPWDYDYSFLEDYQWGRSWASPTGYLAYACRIDASCAADWRLAVDDVLDDIDALDSEGLVEDLRDVLETPISQDPKSPCTTGNVDAAQNHIAHWVSVRSDYMRGFWNL